MDLRKILTALRKPSTPSAAIRAELDRMPAAIDAAEREVLRLEAERRAGILDSTDAQITAVETKIRDANLAVERLFVAREELERRLADAESEEGETVRKAKHAEAERRAISARKALARYPDLAGQIVAIIREVAEAEAAIAAANADLPAGAEPMATVEQSTRGLPADQAVEVSDKLLPARWVVVEDGSVVAPDDEKFIERQEDGSHLIYIPHHGISGRRKVEKRRDREIRTLPYRSAFRPERLAASIMLPGYLPNQPTIWDRVDNAQVAFYVDPAFSAPAIIEAAVKSADGAHRRPIDPRGERMPEVRIVPANAVDTDTGEVAA